MQQLNLQLNNKTVSDVSGEVSQRIPDSLDYALFLPEKLLH